MAKTRAVNLFLDSESLEAVDGDLVSQEVLQVKLDPAGGLSKGPNGLGATAVVEAPPIEGLKFSYDEIEANLSSVSVYPAGANVPEILIPYDGHIYGLSIRLSDVPTAGGSSCILVKPTINGVAVGGGTFDCIFDSGSPSQDAYAVDPTGSVTFSAGDRLGLVITTSASLTPITLNLVADLTIIGS